jgi:putative membrane protein
LAGQHYGEGCRHCACWSKAYVLHGSSLILSNDKRFSGELSLCFWWALFYRHQELQGYGVAELAVFTTALHSSLLGALLTLAPTPWYLAYAHTTAAWGLTSLEDQQLGGLIMWIPAGGLYLLAALTLGAGWLRAAERQVLRQAR